MNATADCPVLERADVGIAGRASKSFVVGSRSRPLPKISSGTVLLIEDDEDVSRFVSTSLRYEGLRVLSSPDGEDGLRLALLRRPDLILLDLLLPSIDGFGILQLLCTFPSLRPIPVVVLTGLSGAKAESTARGSHNVLRYLRKPLDQDELSRVVREILDLPGPR